MKPKRKTCRHIGRALWFLTFTGYWVKWCGVCGGLLIGDRWERPRRRT